LGLFVTIAAALAATCYGVASCRVLVVTFDTSSSPTSSSTGSCFEDYFQTYTSGWSSSDGNTLEQAANATSTCRVGMGLFQWLRPNNDDDNASWQDGYCVGYQQSMLTYLTQDTLFEITRGLGIFSVLLSFVLLGWSFVMSCLEWNWMQMFLLRLCLLAASAASGFALFVKKTELCSNLLDDGTECQFDQGGLAMITACILWLIALIITTVFMESSTTCPCGSLSSWRASHKKRSGTPATETGNIPGTYSFDSTESWTKPVPKAVTVDDLTQQDQMEVYIGSRLDRIESLAGDEDVDDDELPPRRGKKPIQESDGIDEPGAAYRV
jgi:hypothetical protein